MSAKQFSLTSQHAPPWPLRAHGALRTHQAPLGICQDARFPPGLGTRTHRITTKKQRIRHIESGQAASRRHNAQLLNSGRSLLSQFTRENRSDE